jgi:hypothetical protein
MGQFASLTDLTIAEIVALVGQSVTEPVLALSDLNIIIQGLTPRTSPTPPPMYTDVPTAVQAAIEAANADSIYFFDAQFSNIVLPATSQDGGVVLNYNPTGDIQPLVDQITNDLVDWDIQVPDADITAMANSIQGQVDSSLLTPSITYGQVSLATDEIVGWVTAYGVFRTGANPDGSYNYGVIYSFCAAVGVPELVTL